MEVAERAWVQKAGSPVCRKVALHKLQIPENLFLKDNSIAATHPIISEFPILYYRPSSVDCFSHPAIDPGRVYFLTSRAAAWSNKKNLSGKER